LGAGLGAGLDRGSTARGGTAAAAAPATSGRAERGSRTWVRGGDGVAAGSGAPAAAPSALAAGFGRAGRRISGSNTIEPTARTIRAIATQSTGLDSQLDSSACTGGADGLGAGGAAASGTGAGGGAAGVVTGAETGGGAASGVEAGGGACGMLAWGTISDGCPPGDRS
jgi:hypothetical protein